MTYTEALAYIHKTVWLGSKPGLSRTAALLNKMGNPQKKLKFVHVVGTNGKGSTSAFLSSILQNAGYKTGLYTSPFINRFNERFRIDGKDISDDELAEITEYIAPFADSMTDDPPTEFELITAIAFEYFARNACDIVVLEAGMGGELDSTNVIDAPECIAFTNIGLDHTAFLGDTVEKIAATKSGVIKRGSHAVLYDALLSVQAVIQEKCRTTDCAFSTVDFSTLRVTSQDLCGITFDYDRFSDLRIRLIGSYQPYNAALAVKCAMVLNARGLAISDKAIHDGLERAEWQGRFEILGTEPTFLLDGSHNPQGLAATVDSFRIYFPDKKIHILIGVMADKDVDEMVNILLPVAHSFVAVKPDNPRAMAAKTLCEKLRACGMKAEYAENIPDGVRMVLDHAQSTDICAALGSLYFSGDVRTAYQTLKNML